jgi:hypothetical protein
MEPLKMKGSTSTESFRSPQQLAATRLRLLVKGTRFRKLAVMEDLGVVLALAGKNDHVREYKLGLIGRALKEAFSSHPGPNMGGGGGSNVGASSAGSGADGEEGEEVYYVPGPGSAMEDIKEQYIKIPSTKGCKGFSIIRTDTTTFLAALLRSRLLMFEWALAPFGKFMKLKYYDVPNVSSSTSSLSPKDSSPSPQESLPMGGEDGMNVAALPKNTDVSAILDLSLSAAFLGPMVVVDDRRKQAEANVLRVECPSVDVGYSKTISQALNVSGSTVVSSSESTPTNGSSRPSPNEVTYSVVVRLAPNRLLVSKDGKTYVLMDHTGTEVPDAERFDWLDPAQMQIIRYPPRCMLLFGDHIVEVRCWNTGQLLAGNSITYRHPIRLLYVGPTSRDVFISTSKKKRVSSIYQFAERDGLLTGKEGPIGKDGSKDAATGGSGSGGKRKTPAALVMDKIGQRDSLGPGNTGNTGSTGRKK